MGLRVEARVELRIEYCMTHWSFEPVFESYAAVAVILAAMAIPLFLAPTYRRLSSRRRAGLIGIRVAVLLLVLLAMLRPTCTSTTVRPQAAALLVLFDQSRSMQFPHVAAGKSRWQAQVESLRRAEAELGKLPAEMQLKIYGYDRELHAVRFAEGRMTLPKGAVGQQTDIGSSLDDAVQQELGKRIAGVILLGDGAQTASAPRVEVLQAGRTLARLESPLYTVGFGPPGNVAESRDLAVENLPEQYTVFVKNELLVRGTVRVRGFVNQDMPVELVAEDPAGKKSSVGTVQVRASEDGQQIPVDLPFVPTQPGQYKLTLRVKEQAGELVTSNNQLSAFVTVLTGGLRVLYLYGDLLGEQRMLRRSIDASPDIQLDDAFVDPRNRDRWPIDLSRVLATPFDAIILESVDASALGPANLKAIAEATERGKGLLMIGGFSSFGAGGYAGTPLADVLPVEIGRLERQDVDPTKPISRDLHLWGDLPMQPARPHPVVRLAADEQNMAAWKSLPPLNGANRLGAEKPRALVLVETPSHKALLVAGDYGKGRVLAFAGNSTYRWWQYGRMSEHRRFWRQVILWLAQREDASQNEVWIKLAQRRYDPHSRISFSAGARSPAGDAIPDATFTAQLTLPDGKKQNVRLAADQGQVTGTLDELPQPGDYLIELQAAKGTESLGKARAQFQILDRDAELSNPAANYDLLSRLSGLTKASGGRAVAPEQLPQLIREIRERRSDSQVEVQSRWQLADTALDAWLLLLVVVGLLVIEWVLRKRWGLV
jgi:uncharacterized membrane protein